MAFKHVFISGWPLRLAMAGTVMGCLVQPALSQRTWDGGGGANRNWSEPANWSGDAVPNNEAVVFDDTAGVGETTLVDAGFVNAISGWRVENTAGQHTTDLQGNTLTLNNSSAFYVGRHIADAALTVQNGTLDLGLNANWQVGDRENAAVDGIARGTLVLSGVQLQSDWANWVIIGRNMDPTGESTGLLDLSGTTAGSVLHVRNGWNSVVGYGRKATGTLRLSEDADTLNVFGPDAGTLVFLLMGSAGNNADGEQTSGLLDAGRGVFQGRLGNLFVGDNPATSGAARAHADFSRVAAGSSLDTYGWETRVGLGRQAGASLTLGAGMRATIGQSAGQTAALRIGEANYPNDEGMITTGRVETAGGIFQLHGNFFYVGHNDQTSGVAMGVVDLLNSAPGTSLDTYGWDTRIGIGRQAVGHLMLGSNVRTRIGQSAAAHASLHVGNSWGRNIDGMTTTGIVAAAGGEFSLHGNYLYVGHNEHSAGAAYGLVDLSAVTGGVMRTYGWETRIGGGRQSTGTLLLGTNMATSFGFSPSQVATFLVGDTRSRNDAGMSTTGRVEVAPGLFSVHASAFYVGHNEHNAGSVHGVVDAAAATGGVIRTYGGEVRVGFGKQAGGSLWLSPAHAVLLGTNTAFSVLRIGDTVGRNDLEEITTGVLDGGGSHFNAELSFVSVGANDASVGQADGLLDLGGVSGGRFRTHGNETRVGFGRRATGEMRFGDDMTVAIGQPDNRTWLRLAEPVGRNAGEEHSAGTIAPNGADFSMHLSFAYIGVNDHTAGRTTGRLDARSAGGGTITTRGGETRIGFGRMADGALWIGTNQTVFFGESDQLTWLRIGDTQNRNENGAVSVGRLEAGPHFESYFSHVFIGHNTHSQGAVTGLVALSRVTTGAFRTVGHETRVGFGRNAHGALHLGSTDDRQGREDNRTWLRIGENGGQPGTHTQGTVLKAAGTLEAWLSNLNVGRNDNNADNQVQGLWDLTGTTLGTNGIDVSGEIRIGQGRNAKGVVRLPAGRLHASNIMYVGDTGEGDFAGSSGVLELNGTRALVERALIGASGAVTTRVGSVSAGLDLLNDDINLHSITNLTVVFAGNPNATEEHHYGLRIAGNHVEWMQGLTNSGAVRVQRGGIQPHYNIDVFVAGSYTYLGIMGPLQPPPPETGLIIQVW